MRKAVFAGSFYPADKRAIEDFFKSVPCGENKKQAKAAIVPHAGYIYSGKTAYKTLCSVDLPDIAVIFCPNHRGLGWALAVSPDSSWETPFGEISVDVELSEKIADFPLAKKDETAHLYEHSLEVQLPILKMLKPNINIVAVSVAVGDESVLDEFAKHINKVTEDKDVIFIASSDMSHYVPADYAARQDKMVIEALKHLDYRLAFKKVMENDISMCGIFPSYLAVKLAKLKGAKNGEVIEYTNSGEVTGDFNEVVAYLGMIFY